jgi:hypothetical protein
VAAVEVTVKSGEKRTFDKVEDFLGVPCEPGVWHAWDEFSSGSYVQKGFLSGEKRCIGQNEDGVLCNRLFVQKSIRVVGDKEKDEDCAMTKATIIHQSATAFHPTKNRPAWGCTKCFHAMCFDCHMYYQQHDRKSPGRKGRNVRANTWKTAGNKDGESGAEN